MIDEWFLYKMLNLVQLEAELKKGELTDELYLQAKNWGYLDSTIERLSGKKVQNPRFAAYKMVDTCAAEFEAKTPYFYSTFDEENEAKEFIERQNSSKKKVIVFGSGPIRIGQGIEFDYCCVHCVWALKEAGYEAIIANNNPETVSTDFDTGDRLYFDPLTKEDVRNLIETEKPYGVVVQFGGQTAIKLTKFLDELGVNILGTSCRQHRRGGGPGAVRRAPGALRHPPPPGPHRLYHRGGPRQRQIELGYPVLLRPSYVLGGQNMIIAHSDEDVEEYMAIITAHELENPVLIDKYLMGTEVEVDAICDGEDYLIPGIMEHIERAGVHSGDSISVYPAQTLSHHVRRTLIEYTGRLARELKVKGLINIQYVVYNHEVYVIEVNPRSSRTVPYISKVTGVPMVALATEIILGKKLKDLGYGTGLYPEGEYVAVKVPVFSFAKLVNVDTHLGPEMKSTGEVLGHRQTVRRGAAQGLSRLRQPDEEVGRRVYQRPGRRQAGSAGSGRQVRVHGLHDLRHRRHRTAS